ncbi:MAG TPA: zf-HC2 domain-containing protein [Myxococcota bacterium]|nr:zf-HC2 domain-containing protein [Myxococcota bacterium]HOH75772.1 zf-HC2 domain-containing protein [Myxococcota bacterium]HPV03282.1 zf-HC2 domain-containing protein [Myxococcota bacterium]
MKCEDASRYYDLYLDGELDSSEMRDVELHLGSCSRCAMAVGREKLFRQRFSERMASLKAPASLDAVIRARTARRRAVLEPRNLAIAASILVVLGVGIPVFVSVTSPVGDIDDASSSVVRAHRQSSDSEVYGSRQAVQGFVRARAPFPTEIPVDDAEGRRLIGARLTSIQDRPAVIYLYDVGGRRVSVAQYLKASSSVPESLRIGRDGDYTVATCPRGEIVQTVVGEGSRETVRQFIPASCTF